MSEKVKSDRHVSHSPGPDRQSSPLKKSPFGEGVDHRVDEAHPSPLPSGDTSDSATRANQVFSDEQASPALEGSPLLPLSDSHADSGTTGTTARTEEELLLQASQLADHLRAQFEELDRREQSLSGQLNELDQERRNVRLWVYQSEEEVNARESKLRIREVEFDQKIDVYKKLAGEQDERERHLTRLREDLDAERERLHDIAEANLQTQRVQLEQQQAEWTKQREAEQAKLERDRSINEIALNRSHEELGLIREQLEKDLSDRKQEHDQQLRQERESFEQICSNEAWELEQQRDGLQKELDDQKQQHDQLMKDERDAFQTQRDAEFHELEEQRTQLQAEFDSRNQACNQRLQEERDAFEKQRDAQLSEIEQQHEQSETELDSRQQQHDQRLQEERKAFEQSRDTQLREMEQQRTVQEKRIRFQQQHLKKARHELETSQQAFRRDRQQTLLGFEQAQTMQRLRLTQLEHYRSLLEERELSVQREFALISESRKLQQSETKSGRERIRQERELWNQQQESQRPEMRRQQDMLALHAKNLEGRRTRLDQLRNELEQTHRDTLETRMAVEEALAQLAQATGLEAAKQRVEAARQGLAEHYQQLRELLTGQRREFDDAQATLQKQKDEFHLERQSLTDGIGAQDERLRVWEEKLHGHANTLQDRESEWTAARGQWMAEKTEAEEIIRGLLKQLTDLNNPRAEAT